MLLTLQSSALAEISSCHSSPESTIITGTSFLSHFQQLPYLISSWRAKVYHDFVNQIHFPKNYGDCGEQIGATASFVLMIMYPDVLSWPGFFSAPRHSASDINVSLLRMKQFKCQTWSTRCCFATNITVFEGTVALVLASVLDPKLHVKRTWTDWMLASCASPSRKVIMTREMALFRSYRLHQDLQAEEIKWTLVEGDELTNVKNYEHEAKPALRGNAAPYANITLAMHCHCDSSWIIWLRFTEFPQTRPNKAVPHYIPNHNSTSVIAMALDSDGKVSIDVD